MTNEERETLGKYEIIEEIGRGANGIVYKALDTRLQRTVALKVLHPRVLWEPDLVARFYKEASAAARLEHPNILDVHDVDEAEGVHYIAMKYLPGHTIELILDEEGPIPLREAIPIVSQIATALDYAHHEGLLHRDIRPSNIMVDDQGHATLMDFGLAVGIDSAYASGPSGLTGTAEYIAPEIWKGEKPDEQSDLYSLGAVVYEMLVGRPPFEGDTAAAIMTKHLTEEPAFPPGLPDRVKPILAKALAKDRQQRYQTAKELVQALEEGVALREESPEKVKTKEKEQRPKRLGAGWIVAGALGVVLLATACFVLLWGGGFPAAMPPTETPTATIEPTTTRTNTPTMSPTSTAAPAATPTMMPSPTAQPTRTPTLVPTAPATQAPTAAPPTATPSTPPPPSGMIYVPAGDFETADGATINLRAYYIDAQPVTCAEYKRCVDSVGCSPVGSWADDYTPMSRATWFDADRYCRWAGKRLPGLAERQVACATPKDWGIGAPGAASWEWVNDQSADGERRLLCRLSDCSSVAEANPLDKSLGLPYGQGRFGFRCAADAE